MYRRQNYKRTATLDGARKAPFKQREVHHAHGSADARNMRSLLAEERRWCQGDFYDDVTDAHYLVGAWEASAGDNRLEGWTAFQILADLRNTDAAYNRRVHCWNAGRAGRMPKRAA